MREFDALCLTPVEPLSPAEIRSLREREHVSQPVFAHYLNVRKDAVSKWERGEKGDSSSLFKAISANYEIGVKSSGMAGNGAPEMMKMRTGWLSFKEHVDQRISSSAPILVIQRLGRRSYDCQSP
jgi:transcriptional regulator with XRE-family HTH domain